MLLLANTLVLILVLFAVLVSLAAVLAEARHLIILVVIRMIDWDRD